MFYQYSNIRKSCDLVTQDYGGDQMLESTLENIIYKLGKGYAQSRFF